LKREFKKEGLKLTFNKESKKKKYKKKKKKKKRFFFFFSFKVYLAIIHAVGSTLSVIKKKLE